MKSAKTVLNLIRVVVSLENQVHDSYYPVLFLQETEGLHAPLGMAQSLKSQDRRSSREHQRQMTSAGHGDLRGSGQPRGHWAQRAMCTFVFILILFREVVDIRMFV